MGADDKGGPVRPEKMKVRISLAHTNREPWSAEEHGRRLNQPGCLEPTFDFFDSFAGDAVREISLRQGMKLVMVDFLPVRATAVKFEVEQAPLEFSFCVSGETGVTFTNATRGLPDEFHTGPGACNISCFPESRGAMVYQPQKRVRGFSIQIDPLLFQSLQEGEPGGIAVNSRFMQEVALNKHYFRHIAMTPSMKMAAHQMLNCPYLGLTRRIYLEGKALELIALQIEGLDLNKKTRITTTALRTSDRERIHQAKDILTRDLTNPPSLVELSRTVGLTHTRLNQGFREIYGTTAFDYLRRQRLEYGRLLLEECRLNVSEVAYAAGFSSPSHFARSFLDHFGIQPSAFLKELLNKTILQRL